MSYLVDTNVVSELRKGSRCDPGVASWFAGVSPEGIYLSVLTLGEIRKGIENIRRRDDSPTAFPTHIAEDVERRVTLRTSAREWPAPRTEDAHPL